MDFGGFGDPSDPTGGFGGPSEPILPPDTEGLPLPDTLPDSGDLDGLEPDWCEQLGDLCVALFEQAVAGLLGDPYLDLLASVEPDCICHDYDPNQVFIGADRRRASRFRCRYRPTSTDLPRAGHYREHRQRDGAGIKVPHTAQYPRRAISCSVGHL